MEKYAHHKKGHYSLHKPNNKSNGSSFVALQDFSLQLECQMDRIKSLKASKLRKGRNQSSLPQIQPIKHTKKSKQNWFIPKLQILVNQIQNRLNTLQKNNTNFYNVRKHPNLFQDHDNRDEGRDGPHIIITPPQYIPMFICNPIQGMPGMQGFQRNSTPINRHAKCDQTNFNSESQINSGKKKVKNSLIITQQRKQQLRRKLRTAFIAVFFIFVFKTFYKTIVYRKCLHYLEIQEIISDEYEGVHNDIYKILINFNLFDEFSKICKKAEVSQDSQKIYKVKFEDEEIIINPEVCQLLVGFLLNQIQESIKNGELDTLRPILSNLIYGGFPFSRFFLAQELKLLNINQDFGYLAINTEVSKMLIINFIFIKIIIYQLLCKKQLLNILYKVYRKKPEQKKFTLFYGKKLTLTLILFYESLNSVFFSGAKKITANYQTLPSYLKVDEMPQLSYQTSLNKQQQQSQTKIKQTSKSLIKNVVCPPNLKSVFINGFQQNWVKIKRIAETLCLQAQNFKRLQIRQLKLQKSFPNREILNNLAQFKFDRIEQIEQNFEGSKKTNSKITISQNRKSDLSKRKKQKRK